MSNFNFLKNIDTDLYEIMQEAEKLYRDEYFEQCIMQTRRFAENICRKVMGNAAKSTDSFDEVLATLKDKSKGNPREKEFLDDLYFIKREGNASAHGGKIQKDGIKALECLQRAFEISINYTQVKKGPNQKTDYLKFDEELLVLGIKKKKKSTLEDKYLEKKKAYQKDFKQPKKLPKTEITNKSANKNDLSLIFGGLITFACIVLYIYAKFFAN